MALKKKVLIITYYWPPSGGAGVQRWLKLSKYLSREDIDVHVLTVDERHASYMQTDLSLLEEVPDAVKVHRTRSFEPINLYAKLVGKKNVPTAGFANVDSKKLSQKIVSSIRSHLFIPDPRKGWNRYAYKRACEVIEQEGIEVVITTSPPHSTQLIGLKLKSRYDITWISDFRDPWTDIYYYKDLGHSPISKAFDKKLERAVLSVSDHILTVSNSFIELFLPKSPSLDPGKFRMIPNGFDEEDFSPDIVPDPEILTFTYTGTMSAIYRPEVFFEAFAIALDRNPGVPVRIQLIGQVSEDIKRTISDSTLPVQFIKTVPHDEVVIYQQKADALLLVIPDIENSHGILPGKIFEYMATRNRIICLGPRDADAASIIEDSGLGTTFDRTEVNSIADHISRIMLDWKNGVQVQPNEEEIQKYSRQSQARAIGRLIKEG